MIRPRAGAGATLGSNTRGFVTVAAMLLMMPLPGAAQHQVDPLDPILDFFQGTSGQEYQAQFSVNPTPGVSSVSDPVGDMGHSSGQPPGFTPAHTDIVDTWALEFDSGPIDLFGPTDASPFWAPTGPLQVEPPNFEVFFTFTGDELHDGGQYDDGALLFGFTLAGSPPTTVPGRCEYIVWIHDLSRAPRFVNHPSLPGDPADGTNLAYGLAISPEGEEWQSSAFALELQEESGGFRFEPTTDVRSFVTSNFVGITVPKSEIGELAGVNFYTFCTDEGVSFEPEDSGSDQTGLIAVGADDLGRLVILETVASTTTTIEPTTTTTTEAVPATTFGPSEPEVAVDAGELPWWPWLLAVAGIASLGWWLVGRRRAGPCQDLLEAWVEAREESVAAEEAAAVAAEESRSSEAALADLDAARKELCREWPPACWPTREGGWVEDDRGRKFTAWDVHMRKVALRGTWTDYREGKLSATEVEARWAEIDTPQLREDFRRRDEEYRSRLQSMGSDLEMAREAFELARDRADKADTEAKWRIDAAAAARRAYDECSGRIRT